MQPTLFNKMVDDLIQPTRYWLQKYNSDSVVYESLWSISKLLESAGSTVLCEFADKCSALAATVLHDDLLNSCKSKNEWEYAYPDAIRSLHEAGKLKLLFQRFPKDGWAPEITCPGVHS